MSRFFDVDGRTVWNPASGRAERFMERVAMLERELGMPSVTAPVLAERAGLDAGATARVPGGAAGTASGTPHAPLSPP